MNGSDYYGIQSTLLGYAGLPRLGVFPFAVQHGWQVVGTRFEAEAKPLEIWVWSERSRQEISAFYPIDKIRVVGSPYLYLDDCPPIKTLHRSLYILPHSSHLTKIGFSHEDLRHLLTKIGDENGGCDVLAYYLDVNEELCKSLRATKSRVLINGGLWSSGFLAAVRSNILHYDTVHFSTFGSAVLFARHEKIPTVYANLNSQATSSACPYFDPAVEAKFPLTGAGIDTSVELGVEHRVEPQQLREWIVHGFWISSPKSLVAKGLRSARSRIRDYRFCVQPSMKLAAKHNSYIDNL